MMKAKYRVAIYEIFDHVEALEATNADLLEALERLLRADDKGFIELKNFRNGTKEAIQKARTQ